MTRNLLLQCSDSFDESTGRVPQVNHQFVLGASVLLPMAVCEKAKAPVDCVSAERVATIQQSLFVRSPHESVRRTNKELNVPKTTVWQVLRKRLHLRPLCNN
jgi:hypothetical protein